VLLKDVLATLVEAKKIEAFEDDERSTVYGRAIAT
jgi:hypothetical protein